MAILGYVFWSQWKGDKGLRKGNKEAISLYTSGVARGGFGGFKPLPLKIDVYFAA